MAIFRMYTGNDGQSHLEEQTVAAHPILGQERTTDRTHSVPRTSGGDCYGLA